MEHDIQNHITLLGDSILLHHLRPVVPMSPALFLWPNKLSKKKSILFSFPSPNPFVPFRDKSSVKYFITRIRDVSCDHTLHHQVDSAELFKTTQVRICSDTITISIAMLVQRLVRSWVKVYFEHRMFCCTTSCTPFGPNGVARTRVRTFGNRCYAVDVAVVVGAELCFDHTN